MSDSLGRSILHSDTLRAQLQVRLSPLKVAVGQTLLWVRNMTVQNLLRKSERSPAQYLADLCELLLQACVWRRDRRAVAFWKTGVCGKATVTTTKARGCASLGYCMDTHGIV